MDTPKELWKMITGNMALIQVNFGQEYDDFKHEGQLVRRLKS